ncbi:hypothetical protein [Pseudoxanthomonas sacheonensis]|uniref:Uncharacterized protein n=1 Tax=Pseudoxanthomonas sacheonensis TaxID=443615 RepID=A0ABU1RW91_9GAMM|nr:hypothetical protein [Pseudoxanthomonas sacheonensis]MDR6842862.1 hypothetical protein [Pseudoxanthomonas sacheonensis]
MPDNTTVATLRPESSTAIPCCRIADGTAVVLEILDPLASGLVKRGDKFRIRLAEPVSVEGKIVLPSGIEGQGEIVHAAKSRGGGKAGELLIAARYLQRDEAIQIRLRGMKLGGHGQDKSALAVGLSVAVGVFAFFVQGDEIFIPAGTLAQAKIAQDMDLIPAAVEPPTPPAAIAEQAIPAPPPAIEDMPPAPQPSITTTQRGVSANTAAAAPTHGSNQTDEE